MALSGHTHIPFVNNCGLWAYAYIEKPVLTNFNRTRYCIGTPDPEFNSGIYEPVHEISNNVACATSKASDQPAHTRSLIRAFASRLSIL